MRRGPAARRRGRGAGTPGPSGAGAATPRTSRCRARRAARRRRCARAPCGCPRPRPAAGRPAGPAAGQCVRTSVMRPASSISCLSGRVADDAPDGVDHRGVGRDRAAPPGLGRGPQAQLGVLAVHEEPLVEPAQRPPVGEAHQEQAAGDDVDRPRVVAGEVAHGLGVEQRRARPQRREHQRARRQAPQRGRGPARPGVELALGRDRAAPDDHVLRGGPGRRPPARRGCRARRSRRG